MRTKTIFSAFAVVALAWGTTACDDGLAGLNENPNLPTDVGAEFILPEAIQNATDQIFGSGLLNLEGVALFAQHYAKIQYPNEDRYELRLQAIETTWSNLYAGPLKDAQTIIEKGRETGTANHEAAGLILKSWIFGVVTDLWGDVPYSEALLLGGENGTSTPRYDRQADIYAGMLTDLERASGLIDPAATGFGSEDLLFDGDMELWRKFANSLRLRFAMRIADVDPAAAQQHFTAALAGGVFESNDEMAQLIYAGSPPNEHPLFENRVRGGRDDHSISKTMVDMLLAWSDPRLPIYAEQNEAGEYVGMPNGMNDGHEIALATISRIGDYWRGTPGAPAVILSYAEVLFLQAEAALRGWGGEPGSLYEAGIRASLEQYGITGATADAYLAQPGVAYDAGSAAEQIATQKWIALYGNGAEGFAEVRRTGYPVLTPGPFALNVNGGQIPVRIPYPGGEQTLNREALLAAIDAQGGGMDYSTRMWWDVD